MFKSVSCRSITADTDHSKVAIATAATLSQTLNGAVRILNVLPMTPVMLAEYASRFRHPAASDLKKRSPSSPRRHRGAAHFPHRGRAASRDPEATASMKADL